MHIYKVIGTYEGMQSELDSKIYWRLEAAHKAAINWLEDDENCISVKIVKEIPDADDGWFTSIEAIRITRKH